MGKLREKTTEKKQYCDRCKYYGNPNSQMFMKKLDYKQTRNKMIEGEIDSISSLVYLGYNYFECPICHYFKFVEK